MNYVNNWLRPLTLSEQAITTTLDLADGQYRLTIADASRSRIEIVDATVTAGTADLVRGSEGTAIQDWPEGSVIYCALTAGQVDILAAAGNDTLSGDEMPAQPPARVGQLYVAPWGTFVGVGTAHPEQWRSIWGYAGDWHTIDATPVGVTEALPRPTRHVRVTNQPPVASGLHRATVVAPAWPVHPEGFQIDILAKADSPIALTLDLSAPLGGGGEVYMNVADLGTGAAFSRSGALLECVASAPLKLRLETLSKSEVFFNAERLPYDSITYINL